LGQVNEHGSVSLS